MTRFADHFSRAAAAYARFRPTYPDALFAWLAAQAPGRHVAWDCAAGSGQAARALAPWFRLVLATDASVAQLAEGAPHQGVHRVGMTAEQAALGDGTVDLVTVAQALHWFARDRFYAEARRVLVPGGVLAAWSYGLATIDPAVDAIIQHLHDDILGPWWPPERALVGDAYRQLDFPGPRLAVPPMAMEARWTRTELAGYLATWSAASRYAAARGADPVARILPALADAWPGDERRLVRWPLTVLVSRSSPAGWGAA